jgi:hypothetical protein
VGVRHRDFASLARNTKRRIINAALGHSE